MPQNAAIKQVLKMREHLPIFGSDQRERQLANRGRGGKRQLAANGFVS